MFELEGCLCGCVFFYVVQKEMKKKSVEGKSVENSGRASSWEVHCAQ